VSVDARDGQQSLWLPAIGLPAQASDDMPPPLRLNRGGGDNRQFAESGLPLEFTAQSLCGVGADAGNDLDGSQTTDRGEGKDNRVAYRISLWARPAHNRFGGTIVAAMRRVRIVPLATGLGAASTSRAAKNEPSLVSVAHLADGGRSRGIQR